MLGEAKCKSCVDTEIEEGKKTKTSPNLTGVIMFIFRPMNFEDEIIPVTQMEPSSSIDFFTSLATQNVYQTAKDENITKFEP